MSEQQPRPAAAPLRVGVLAAYAGGALTAAGALGVGVLFGQVLLARLTIPGAEAPPPRCDGEYGSDKQGMPLRLAVLGDSTAAGFGVATRAETPGALLAGWISDAVDRPVRLSCPAVVGSVSAWLPAQVETVLEADVPDVAIIFIGANDVTTAAKERDAVGHLGEAVATLRGAGAEVVVATCPDLGTIRPILPPLRWLARRWSRQLATAQTVAVVRAGGRTVSLGDLLGPRFDAAPERMFGADRYHPSVEGYRVAAEVVLPSALAALGLPAARPSAPPPRARRRITLRDAAQAAVRNPGTEVTADGALARLRRRVRHSLPVVSRPGATQPAGFAVPSVTGAPHGSPQHR